MKSDPVNTISEAGAGWVPNPSTFPARLALIRQHKGWGNVREAARACGVPAESWRRWERDCMEPRNYMTVCRQIASSTGCSLTWLIGMHDEQVSA